jgi:hypothetical protein
MRSGLRLAIPNSESFGNQPVKGNMTMNRNSQTSRGAQDQRLQPYPGSGVLFHLPRPVSTISSMPITLLSVVKDLPRTVEHRPITCSWPVETPAISTQLPPISTIGQPSRSKRASRVSRLRQLAAKQQPSRPRQSQLHLRRLCARYCCEYQCNRDIAL